MKRILKYLGIAVGLLLVVALLLYGYISWSVSSKRARTHEFDVQTPEIPEGKEAIQRGKHSARIRGCGDCHGDDGSGTIFIQSGGMGTFAGSNLTTGEAGVSDLGPEGWAKAVRHGVDPDGKPLVFMPAHDYDSVSNRELGALIAYYRSLPPIDEPAPRLEIGPMARLLWFLGNMPNLFPVDLADHAGEVPADPEHAPTVEFGEYLASTCTGCHGKDFSGGPIPGVPPKWPKAANITPHETGIGDYSKGAFFELLNTGRTPDGRTLNSTYMPWKNFKYMTETEKTAIWKYLQSIEPVETDH